MPTTSLSYNSKSVDVVYDHYKDEVELLEVYYKGRNINYWCSIHNRVSLGFTYNAWDEIQDELYQEVVERGHKQHPSAVVAPYTMSEAEKAK